MAWKQRSILSLSLMGLMSAVPAAAQTCVPPPSGLVSWWPGDGDASDIVGQNNGTLHGTATFAKGLVGQAFSFDGSIGTFVDAATIGLPIGNSNRTLEMWIRIDRYVPGVEEAFFAGYGAFGSFNQVYVLGAREDRGLFFSQWGLDIDGPILVPETWYHIAVTNVGDQIMLYLDGIAVNEGQLPIMTASSTRFEIGSIPLPFGDVRRLQGLVDEVSVYNRVLSPDEIHSIFAAGSAGKCHPAQNVDVAGNLTMRNSTSLGVGNILKEGVPFVHNFGTSNTFIGIGAGNFMMTGFENTGSGFGALSSNTSGYDNTATGFIALPGNTTGNSNTGTGSGTLLNNTEGNDNTATGFEALHENIDGSFNTAGGFRALFGNTTGSNNTALGSNANVSEGDLTNATAIGNGAIVDASNKIRFGNGDVAVIEGEVPYTFTSDRNEKENLRSVDAEVVLTKLRGLVVTSWNYKRQDPKKFRHYGPVAQDFFAAFGRDAIGTIGTPTTITSGDLDGILMIATQALEKRSVEQAKRAREQDRRISKEMKALRTENADLKARLELLERRVSGEDTEK